MAKPNDPAHRKQVLKQRRAEEQRQWNRAEAADLFNEAFRLVREGDSPAADRLLRKALTLDPECTDALALLAQIHHAAGHFAEALGYLRQARKLSPDPVLLYNLGVVYRAMGEWDNAIQAMQSFLAPPKDPRNSGSKSCASPPKL
jgi:tetratricopeptide (TPR) repeat protein